MLLIVGHPVYLLEAGGLSRYVRTRRASKLPTPTMKGKDCYGYRVERQLPRGEWGEHLPRDARKRTLRALRSGRYGGWRPLRSGGRDPLRRVHRRHLRSARQFAQPPPRRMGGYLDRGALGGRRRVDRGLRRLMRNCEEPRRSQDRMLMHQTLSKGWCHARSRLLLGLIVRVGGRLVEAQALFGAAQSWTASLAYRPRGHHPGHPRPVAPLQKRARFLA